MVTKKPKTWEERQDAKETKEIAAKTAKAKKPEKEKPFAFAKDDSLKFVCMSGDGLYGKFGFGHTCEEAIAACKRAGGKLAEHGFYVKVTDSKVLRVMQDGSLEIILTEKFPHGTKYAATRCHGRTQETFFYEPFVDVPMKEDVKLADITALEMRKSVTWLGWAVFSCEVHPMTGECKYVCWLFRERPDNQPEDRGGGWLTTGGVSLPPAFLAACGLDVSWKEPPVSEFYQGQQCRFNTHPPIKIALTLPRELLQALKLLPED